MTDIIIFLVVAAILGTAVWYIRREKKRGVKCIGCSHAKQCAAKNKKCQ